jgi:hypothetical protein
MRLLLLSAPKQIDLLRLKNLFETCHTPAEVTEWVDKVQEEDVMIGPVKEVLETIYDLQKNDTEAPEIGSIRIKLKEKLAKSMSKTELKSLIEILKVFIPGFISVEGEQIGVQGHPDKLLEVIYNAIGNVPNELQQMYISAFSPEANKNIDHGSQKSSLLQR